jgi:hypothetical protein
MFTYLRLNPGLVPADDYDGNPKTTGNILTGGLGNIERRGDADWFKMELAGGQTYTFSLKTGSIPQILPFLPDPFLSLYNSDGEFI